MMRFCILFIFFIGLLSQGVIAVDKTAPQLLSGTTMAVLQNGDVINGDNKNKKEVPKEEKEEDVEENETEDEKEKDVVSAFGSVITQNTSLSIFLRKKNTYVTYNLGVCSLSKPPFYILYTCLKVFC